MAKGQRQEKGCKGQENGGKEEGRTWWTCGKSGHVAAWCRQGGYKILYASDETVREHVVEGN